LEVAAGDQLVQPVPQSMATFKWGRDSLLHEEQLDLFCTVAIHPLSSQPIQMHDTFLPQVQGFAFVFADKGSCWHICLLRSLNTMDFHDAIHWLCHFKTTTKFIQVTCLFCWGREASLQADTIFQIWNGKQLIYMMYLMDDLW